MIDIEVDASDLLKFARYLETVPRKTNRALARALNTAGDNIMRNSVEYLSEATGLAPTDIEPMLSIHQATPDDLSWSFDASAVTLTGADDAPSRPWETLGDHTFDVQQLLRIVTSEDDTVCEICQQAAENSPYTVDEINQMAIKWKDFVPPKPVVGPRTNLIHPNCRCITQPWQASRRLSVEFPSMQPSRPVVLSMKQLGEIVAHELGAELKVKS